MRRIRCLLILCCEVEVVQAAEKEEVVCEGEIEREMLPCKERWFISWLRRSWTYSFSSRRSLWSSFFFLGVWDVRAKRGSFVGSACGGLRRFWFLLCRPFRLWVGRAWLLEISWFLCWGACVRDWDVIPR